MKRPSSKERRTTILRAAAETFFEHGYEATSIDTIIERIGGSKRSIYNEFGNKEGLFTALVSESADEALTALAVEEMVGRNIEDTLLEFGQRLLSIYMSKNLVGVYRTIVTAASRFPDLASAFYQKGPERSATRLAEVLEEARSRGEIDIDDCQMAANHFVGMLRSNLHLQVVLGLREPPCKKEAETIVRSAVDILLDGVRTPKLAGKI